MPGSPNLYDPNGNFLDTNGYNPGTLNRRGDEISKQAKGQMDGEDVHTAKSDVSTFRVWTALALYMFCYNTAFMATIPVTAQYLTHRISEDWYNFTNFTNFTKQIPCTKEANDSNTKTRDEIQKDVSSLSLFINYASSLPAILTCLPLGTLSDHFGRKKVIFAPMFGAFVRTLVYVLVVALKLNLSYLFIGSVVDGLCGSYHANSLLSAAVVADITSTAGGRAISFAIIECIVILSSALSSLSVGYFIEWKGYVYPTAMMTILVGLATLSILFILPETLHQSKKTKLTLNPFTHLKRVIGFYTFAGPSRKRVLYRIGVFMFFLNIVVSIGRSPVETLYQLNSPFCWNSVKIGIFSSIQSSVQIICSIAALRILKTCLSLEAIGIIALLCAIGGYILEGLAVVDIMLYLVPVVGLIIYTVTPITRTLLSRMASPSDQGALFASLSVVDAVSGILSFTVYNSTYIATLGFYRGTVFFVMAGICAVNIMLFSIFKKISSKFDSSLTIPILSDADSEHKTQGVTDSLSRSAQYDSLRV